MTLAVFLDNLFSFLTENRLSRMFLRFLQGLVRFPKDVGIRIENNVFYARTLDRVVALYLRKFFFSKSFEANLFRSVLRQGMRVIDVGANFGYYTVVSADFIGREGRVFAFEPDPGNFSLLLKNIDVNGCENVEALNLAISDKPGKTTLFLSKEHHGDHRIYDNHEGRKAINVEATALDIFFDKNPKADIIKVDVQGAEAKVFSGMKMLIEKNPQVLVFTEFWPKGLRQAGVSPKDFLNQIQDLGFSISIIDEAAKSLKTSTIDGVLKASEKAPYLNLFLKK
ncbi:MAG: FkbM family methyltransferase [Candidatus Nealsonbacteria bacterium]|nr:FkbM family methyltransferase [Candidatus Nealsonbacteria bacterium]